MSDADFARKLALVAKTLGCRTQKELLGYLLAVNPKTSFDPARAYKWRQGLAAPRDSGIYQDFADVLGLRQSGEALRTCSFEAFEAMVAYRAGTAPAATPVAAAADLSHLHGRYVLYMASFSTFPSPRIFRIAARIETRSGGPTGIRADVPMSGQIVRFEGQLLTAGGLVTATLRDDASRTAMIVWFADPTRPVRAIGGLIGGQPAYIADVVPSCSRMVLVRAPDDAAVPEAETFYFEFEEEAITRDFEAIGYHEARPAKAALHLLDFLSAASDRPLVRVPAEALDHLQAAFERAG